MILVAGFFFWMDIVFIKMMDSLINYFENQKSDIIYLMKISLLLLFSKLIYVVFQKNYLMYQKTFAVEISLRLRCLIYEKIFKKAAISSKKISSKGEVQNYILVDSSKVNKMAQLIPEFFVNPIKILVYSYILISILGLSFFLGFIIMSALIIINFYVYKKLPSLKHEFLKRKDQRMQHTAEILDNIKTIKMYDRDSHFLKTVIKISKLFF